MKHFGTLVCLVFLFMSSPTSSLLDEYFSPEFYQKLAQVYGDEATSRARSWRKIIDDNQLASDWVKINKVNHFFNQNIKYQDDLPLWGKKDYWASPVETIGRGLGDCEDYAIAKFFSLTALGVPEGKLRLMYVRQLTINQPHMVLIYFENAKAMPLVLDNYNPKILAANKRRDLKPVYSFNGQGLWISKAKGLGRKVKKSGGVSAWSNLLQRIEQGEMQTIAMPAS